MLRSFCVLPFLLLGTQSAYAQRPAIDPPIAGRPIDFSSIVGNYTIEASADARSVLVEEPITLRIRIAGMGPPKYEPARKNLQILPDWQADFFVENVPDEDRVVKDEKAWLFVYRLRPKHAKVNEIDGIKLVYFDPDTRKYATRYADRIEIRVKPNTDPPVEAPMPQATPNSFYDIADSADILTPADARSMSALGFSLLLVIPPLVCVSGLLLWRRFFPDEHIRRARQRSEASRRALARLKTGDAPWSTVHGFLEERFEFEVDDPTPADVEAFLKRRGFASDHCAQAKAFFQVCDAGRFGMTPADAERLKKDAANLIQRLEADACVR